MVQASQAIEASREAPVDSPLILYKPQLSFDPKDSRALICDFFSWLENEWGLPVVQGSLTEGYELLNRLPTRSLLEEEKTYTAADLSSLWGYSLIKVQSDIIRNKIGTRAIGKTRGPNGYNLYLGRDLVSLADKWKQDSIKKIFDALWLRFLQEPCGVCNYCLNHPNKNPFHCYNSRAYQIKRYRSAFFDFLEKIQRYGDIERWWQHERATAFAQKSHDTPGYSGVVLVYLLDRHLLHLSIDEFLRLPFQDIRHKDFLRPWCHRRPKEYETFVLAMKKVGYATRAQNESLTLVATLVLLRYGLPGVAELGRRLAPAEIRQAAHEGRLLTQHIAYGVSLSFPQSKDIRIGHVILDEVRAYFWNYITAITLDSNNGRAVAWNGVPKTWNQQNIRAIERALSICVLEGEHSILPLRPETEKMLVNPHALLLRAEQTNHALSLLPKYMQNTIQAYIDYRYEYQHIALGTLAQDLEDILSFLCWTQEQSTLKEYIYWDQHTTYAAVSAFFSEKHPNYSGKMKGFVASKIHVFFETLAEMELPYAPGYEELRKFLTRDKDEVCAIPPEEVLDRLFHDGVCKLDYDPFSRLALTIQYYCGTRVKETCDLPLFCVLEDPDSKSASLVIPFGKTRQERLFPIVSVGMGPLLTYMDQVFHMQVDPPGDEISRETPRNLPRMNVHYLETDTTKAYHWDYLFDRRDYSTEHRNMRQGVLNPTRVRKALKEAQLFAARQNPQGLMQLGTYSRHCRRRRRKGQMCEYFAMRDGITSCPVCGNALPGTRGSRCYHRVAEKFVCDGVAREGEYFCPKCDAPLADLVKITPHTFRHNSVTRAHRYGASLEHNMRLHGHRTIPVHIRYLHLLPQDQQDAVYRLFSEKLLRQLHLETTYAPGQVIEEGVAYTPTVGRALEVTLYRGLKRRTTGVWGAFWAGALAEHGVTSPTQLRAELIITEETYHLAVAQYRYEALGVAVSELALERGTHKKFIAHVAPFLERREIEELVDEYLEHVQQGYLTTKQGVRLLEADIQAQWAVLHEIEEMLRPWWHPIGGIDQLVIALFPGIDNFQKPGAFVELGKE